jgi:anti-sigma regulatory factor (Ser/Thr protein kinase)
LSPGERTAAVLERRLRNDFAALAVVAGEVRAHLGRHGVGERLTHAVDLALEELVGNTIRYGYDDSEAHEIRVRVSVAAPCVQVTIEDDARPFDPTRVAAPPPAASLPDAPAGGRGIAMVRRLIEDMRYRREGGLNALELRLPRNPA